MNDEMILDCEQCKGFVEEAFMMALDDDYPDVMDKCVVYIMDELNTDNSDYAEKVMNKIMGWA